MRQSHYVKRRSLILPAGVVHRASSRAAMPVDGRSIRSELDQLFGAPTVVPPVWTA